MAQLLLCKSIAVPVVGTTTNCELGFMITLSFIISLSTNIRILMLCDEPEIT